MGEKQLLQNAICNFILAFYFNKVLVEINDNSLINALTQNTHNSRQQAPSTQRAKDSPLP